MVWCSHCNRRTPTARAEDGFICCSICAKVVHQDVYTEEPTFVKDAGGQSRLGGSVVHSVRNDCSESLKRSLNDATNVIKDIECHLNGNNGSNNDSFISQACNYYQMAAERSFTRGRRINQVAAACLYIAFRENKRPFLLIDFSEYLKINVYVLGAVFLQLCKLLSLVEHDIVQKVIDPSLFIHRFTRRLLEKSNTETKCVMGISKTALRIIASMKRDWMQTGRKPSGLCGAAVYISALAHGFKYSKSDIVRVVHICEATLTKRLIEFENTNSGSLTIEEFNKNAEELEQELKSYEMPDVGSKRSGVAEVLCVHKGSGKPPFAHGLCRSCYEDLFLHCGSDPPAFQCAERNRIAIVSAEKANESNFVFALHQEKTNAKHVNETFMSVEASAEANQNVTDNGNTELMESENVRDAIGDQVKTNGVSEMSREFEYINTVADESDCLSDIDDAEVNGYLNNKEEIHYKKIIWEEVNKEYLEEQAAKEAAAMEAAAVMDMSEASDDLLAAHELAAAAAAAVAKLRKERQQKRALEAKDASPAQTAAEATRQMLTKKRISSKINYDVLEKLFNCDTVVPDFKKARVESHWDSDATKQQLGEKEHKAVIMDNSDELGEENEDMEEQGARVVYSNEPYLQNEEEVYDYDYDDGYNGY